MRVLPIGPGSFMVELRDLDQTLALFDALAADPLPGIAEIIPAARTLMIRSAPGVAADATLARAIRARLPAPDAPPPDRPPGATVEIPTTYDGADLADVARLMGLTVAEVIAAHQAATWQVAFTGFAPGFAYMTSDDPRFDLPRRATPRTRIPAGSVALAGRFSGIYPQETPGGWQLIGRSTRPMWDLARDPPALLRPGLRCRFVAGGAPLHPVAALPAEAPAAVLPDETPSARGLRLMSTPFPILFQDEGRPGQSGQGVSASGALDRRSLRAANRAVGNPAQAAALELTLGGARFLAEVPMVLALAGAARAQVGGTTIAPGAAFALDAGDELVIAPPACGMRSYLALRGGYAVSPVLGSAATDTLAHVGPPPVLAGAVLGLARAPALATGLPDPDPDADCGPALPAAGDLVRLPVILGPRADWFAPEVVQQFLTQDWTVTPQSSRVGVRLAGAVPLARADSRELPSEGTETGAIQVPHSGQPVLFLADHPLTGGYPVIATLHPAALDLAGQLPPGTRLRFCADAAFAPLSV